MLEQVVENLIKNGIEAQPDGGYLCVTVDRQGYEAVLTIENRGFTLPVHEAERILEPYFTTKTRGTGLGLAITQRIIHAHGGRIEVQVPVTGSLQMSVYLPMK
jgi:signal transduction histidine kinase